MGFNQDLAVPAMSNTLVTIHAKDANESKLEAMMFSFYSLGHVPDSFGKQ
jgi:hypothetical protein